MPRGGDEVWGADVTPEGLGIVLMFVAMVGVLGSLILLAGLYVVEIWRALHQWWWARAGQCVCCGYDLTGNGSGVCPECGAPIQK